MKPLWTLLFTLLLLPAVTQAQFARPQAGVSTALNAEHLRAGDSAVLAIVVNIPANLHAQSHTPLEPNLIPMTATLDGSAVKLRRVVYPPGEVKTYPLLGKVSVYTGKTTLYAILDVPPDAAGEVALSGKVRLQLCDDKSCFAPTNVPFSVSAKVVPATDPKPERANAAIFEAFDAKLFDQPATQAIAEPLPAEIPGAEARSADGPQSFLGAIGFALLAGLIFNVMPCVLPVLPLKAVGFYESSGHDRARTFLFGVVFSLGVIAVFALLALLLLAGKSIVGKQVQWGEMFAYGWFVWGMVIVLLLLALWLLGAFGVGLPTSIYGLSFRHDTFTGNFLWGGLTAVLSTPCTAPLLPGVITFALVQPAIVGFTVLLCVGVGMALPYLVLSAFPNLARKFPRTGPFAELFKQMMAFLLIGTAAFFLGTRIVADPKQWWLVFAVVVGAAVFLIIRTRQILPSPRAITISTVLAVGMIASGFAGAHYLTQPSKGFIDYTPQTFAEARQGDDIVLVKFTAAWCLNCKYVERTVFHDDAMLAELQRAGVRLIKVDLTDSDAPGWNLRNQLGGSGIPFTAIWPAGKETPVTLDSIYTQDALRQAVARAKKG